MPSLFRTLVKAALGTRKTIDFIGGTELVYMEASQILVRFRHIAAADQENVVVTLFYMNRNSSNGLVSGHIEYSV